MNESTTCDDRTQRPKAQRATTERNDRKHNLRRTNLHLQSSWHQSFRRHLALLHTNKLIARLQRPKAQPATTERSFYKLLLHRSFGSLSLIGLGLSKRGGVSGVYHSCLITRNALLINFTFLLHRVGLNHQPLD